MKFNEYHWDYDGYDIVFDSALSTEHFVKEGDMFIVEIEQRWCANAQKIMPTVVFKNILDESLKENI